LSLRAHHLGSDRGGGEARQVMWWAEATELDRGKGKQARMGQWVEATGARQ